MEEQWKALPGFEGHYEVSSQGRIKSVARQRKAKLGATSSVRERIMKLREHTKGYMQVQLHGPEGHKMVKVHQAVAKAFIPNPENKPQVNHKDGDKKNNEVSNLEWMTNRENYDHSKQAGLREKRHKRAVEKFSVDGQFIARFASVKEACASINKPSASIGAALKYSSRTAYGYKWKYAQ